MGGDVTPECVEVFLVQLGSKWPQRSAADTDASCCRSFSSWTSWKSSVEPVGRLHSSRGGLTFEKKVFLEKLPNWTSGTFAHTHTHRCADERPIIYEQT